MERAWVFGGLAVTVAEIDFLDPAHAGAPGARERGVRLELRHVDVLAHGTVYSSPQLSLRPAAIRIDALESAPGAADRMHWHPVMHDGEPGDRVFDEAMPTDPVAWIRTSLRSVDEVLRRSGADERNPHHADISAIAAAADEIAEVVHDGLSRMREPWPEVRHDERGMAVDPGDPT